MVMSGLHTDPTKRPSTSKHRDRVSDCTTAEKEELQRWHTTYPKAVVSYGCRISTS